MKWSVTATVECCLGGAVIIHGFFTITYDTANIIVSPLLSFLRCFVVDSSESNTSSAKVRSDHRRTQHHLATRTTHRHHNYFISQIINTSTPPYEIISYFATANRYLYLSILKNENIFQRFRSTFLLWGDDYHAFLPSLCGFPSDKIFFIQDGNIFYRYSRDHNICYIRVLHSTRTKWK